jgi:hypothetical protein
MPSAVVALTAPVVGHRAGEERRYAVPAVWLAAGRALKATRIIAARERIIAMTRKT